MLAAARWSKMIVTTQISELLAEHSLRNISLQLFFLTVTLFYKTQYSAKCKQFTGLPLLFSKLFPGFPNFFQVFKSTHFCVCF